MKALTAVACLLAVGVSGCIFDSPGGALDDVWGVSRLAYYEGDLAIYRNVVQADVGDGWTSEPVRHANGPAVFIDKPAPNTMDGQDIPLTLPAPPEFRLRLIESDKLTGLDVQWRVRDAEGNEQDIPLAAANATVTVRGAWSVYSVIADVYDDDRLVASTTGFIVAASIRWHVQSSVWPMAPLGQDFWNNEQQADMADFVQIPLPAGNPLAMRFEVATWKNASRSGAGLDVDLEAITPNGASLGYSAAGGTTGQASTEALVFTALTPGTWSLRIGWISDEACACTYDNEGTVPYDAEIYLKFEFHDTITLA